MADGYLQGFMGGLTAPVDTPVDYSNVPAYLGSRLRGLFYDPYRKFSTAIDKGFSGQPITMEDQMALLEGLSMVPAGGFMRSAITGAERNTLYSLAGGGGSKGVKEVSERLKTRGIDNFLYETDSNITLDMIKVPKKMQKQGYGSKAIEEITEYADKTGKTISLTPSTDFGASSVPRLKKFYKRFGFVENKGKNKDYSISDTMYREPK